MGRRAAHEDQQDQLRRLRAEQLSTTLTTMPKPPADTVHGTQPGDPAKAANAIIAAVESDEPPAFLLLGNDALNIYRRLAEARLDTINKWEHLTTGTDIDA